MCTELKNISPDVRKFVDKWLAFALKHGYKPTLCWWDSRWQDDFGVAPMPRNLYQLLGLAGEGEYPPGSRLAFQTRHDGAK